MKIEKITEPRYAVELSKREIGIIAYLLGRSSADDYKGTAHEKYATGIASKLFEGFNDTWASS